MAQAGTNTWQKNVLCRYFMNGLCQNGDNCAYSHNPHLSNRGTLPCKFFQKGTCAYGRDCRFSHGQPLPQNQPPLMPVIDDLADTFQGMNFKTSSVASFDQLDSGVVSEATSTATQPDFEEGAVSTWPDTSWAEAPEFVPGQFQAPAADDGPKTWAQIVNPGGPAKPSDLSVSDAESHLCPFQMVGECRYGEHCAYVHGELCELCGKAAIYPGHDVQRKKHVESCMSQHELDMELAFAVAKSKEKTCGICMEVVMDKPKGEARFGIMPNCNHCFCLTCLRKWRQAKQFENKVIRACPECRQTSDYICPSRYWIDTDEEKNELLRNYRKALNTIECKYFKRGEGECPFGNKCFYRHVSADGKDIDVGPPSRRTRRTNAEGDLTLVQRLLLYDFLEEREGRMVLPLEYLDILEFLSDSEDSEWSEYEIL